ncbi:MAG: monofunctional biosynthetic peptidoglycan transglycosylase [Gammaproteobacteria bacterium]|nr:monofunctional biosynthetic peptidoglycan transglycosylase [Gammaproteobacteria bacterium]
MGHFLNEARLKAVADGLRSLKRPWLVRIGRGLWKTAQIFIAGSVVLILILRWLPLPTSSMMIQHGIKAWWAGEGAATRYVWTPYPDISPYAGLAVIAAEDQRFPDHHGFDFVEIQEALEDQEEGKPLRGASTLSQQVAKNLLLWPGRSFIRKGLEAWFTLLLELLWPKQRILEVYLNIAEFGDATFGVEAASQRFFNKPAARLSADEAARLAAVLPSPQRYRVDKPSAYVLKRQRWIEKQMRQLGGVAYLDRL